MPSSKDTPPLAWLFLLALAVGVYVMGLGGQYVPTNGDEMVYAHIARLTAASHHWLPLVSELENTRNTKPPLLFWQAIIASDWGRNWQLAALRAPSLIYTLLITAAVAWTVRLITRHWRDALIAACVYLAFYSSFHYGRPYLTSAPETFWFSVPMFGLLWHSLAGNNPSPRAQAAGPGLLAHAGFGLALGLGLAYKSFALIVPAAAALWCGLLLSQPRLHWRLVLWATLRTGLSAALALGLFALWFALDPDPGAVWREFVVGENAAKFSDPKGYWHEALAGGGSSLWAQLLAYAVNAGLLGFVVIGLAWAGWKNFRQAGNRPALSPHLRILLPWLAVWLIVFTLPSQRTARYVIPAMPAVAILIALYWHRLQRRWFLLSLLLTGIPQVLLARIAWVAHDLGIASGMQGLMALAAAALGAAAVAAGTLKPAWTRACAVLACLSVYACFGLTVAPLDGPAGRYASPAAADLRHARIAVPTNFKGQFERFEFLLPGHRFVPYDAGNRALSRGKDPATAGLLDELLHRHDAVVWTQSTPAEMAPPCVPGCTVLGSRWQLKSRHQRGEIDLSNLWQPQAWLFRREWLVRRATPP